MTKVLSGKDAFKLHATYGLPIEVMTMYAESKGWKVDVEGYEKLMEEHREKSRRGSKLKKNIWGAE